MKIEHVHVCPYCMSDVAEGKMCCSEVHGQWMYLAENGEEKTKEEYEAQDV